MAKDWTEPENEAIVQDYFDMLCLELNGKKYDKTERRNALIERLNDRSHSSVEFKHQNISAILVEMGMPYINGYKPRANYQRKILPDVISDYLVNNPAIQTLFQNDSDKVPAVPSVADFLAVMEEPPEQWSKEPPVTSPSIILNPTGVNYLEREAHNQKLGEAGEQFVINFERARLERAGMGSLADRIEQVSVTQGPSAGFDILSFERNGTDRYIEAKTTKHGKSTPFFITPNELNFSKQNSSRYFLYRLFNFREDPRMFKLHGYLQEQCSLKPSTFIAKSL